MTSQRAQTRTVPQPQVPVSAGERLQRQRPGDPSPERGGVLQRAAIAPFSGHEAPPIVQEVLHSPGQPLDEATRVFMEPRFGRDFSGVRVHTDAKAAESARAVHALAYTVGHTMVFASGQYSPGGRAGQELIAHELAHVAQQSARPSAVSSGLTISDQGERQAHEAARAVMSGQRDVNPLTQVGGPVLARKAAPQGDALATFDERLKRIEELLSYGLFDWAITDAEAVEAFTLLKAMSQPERSKALKAIRLDRLIDNLPAAYQPELAKIVAESGGERTVLKEVKNILTYSFFDWIGSVSADEAKQALGLLEALPDEQRDRVIGTLPREKRRRLYDALAPDGQARFMKMWEDRSARELERQKQELHQIVPGEAFLIRVVMVETNQLVDTFAPDGVLFEVDDAGYAYYTPLDVWIHIAGLRRREAEAKLAKEFTAKAGLALGVELRPRPAGQEAGFLETTPARRPSRGAAPVSEAPTAESKPDPYAEKRREFLAIYSSQAAALKQLGEQWRVSKDKKLWDEWEREQEALDRFFKWFDANQNSPVILKTDLARLLGQLKAEATGRQIKQQVARKIEEEKEARAFSPAMQKARLDKNDEFLNLALKLRGESARRFPYVIPVPSEGIDILVTGDPARQAVLNQVADELMGWSREHFTDDNYTTVSPNAILLYVLKSGYGTLLREADKAPVKAEAIDRHEVVPGKMAAAFGKTVAVGLAVIGIVGAAVGLGLISGGAALIILGAVAAYAGITAYMQRRQEIEEKGYDVPVAVTAVNAAGDAVGVSQLIEGMTGERLAIGERLKSAERSEQAGVGVGSVALLLAGSRAYRFGQNIGQQVRLSRPGLVPETLEGVPLRDLGKQFAQHQAPRPPIRNATPGPVEAHARAALSERLRVGFDRWMEQIRGKNPNADVEAILKKMSQERIAEICRRPAEDFYAQLSEAERLTSAKMRSWGDPLRPNLKHRVWKDGVTIHYEKTPPSEVEISHGREIQTRTGEPVHLFGDTPAGKSYPGIDGTIGEPPRALQLKNVADPGYVKVHAADAFESAVNNGYSKVEVHIRIKDSTIAEIRAAWQGKPAHPRGAEIGWETRLSLARSKLSLARLVIEGKDGVWTVEAPPTSPNLPGVRVPVPGEKQEQGQLIKATP